MLRELGGSRLGRREFGEFRFRQSKLVGSRLRQPNRLLQVGAEEVRSSRLGKKDLAGSCVGRREVSDSRLRQRELGGSRPIIIHQEGRLLQVVRDRARRLQIGIEGA